jgi:TRAP-type C4-dicarboxylate transport system substrate-binding protein
MEQTRMKKSLLHATIAALAGLATVALSATPALAATTGTVAKIKLRVADSFPSGHYVPEYLIKPMMERLAADKSLGVEFEYYPAEQLGKSRDMLSLTEAGLVDIAYVAPAFATDKMPLSVVAELPLPFTGSCQGTMAYWNLAKPGGLIDRKEFAPNGVRLLFTLVLPPYQLFTLTPFSNLKDITGRKIRTTGAAKELTLKRLGTVPIQIPTPDVYEALSRGTIDGMLFPFNSLRPYDLDKIKQYSTVGENFGSFVITYVISTKKWETLTPALQTALGSLGEELSRSACTKTENDEARDIAQAKKSGLVLIPFKPAESTALRSVLSGVSLDWAKNLDRQRRGGTEVLNAFTAGLK